jgi:UDP-N-acetylmuramoyl-tripeptide--D-alanyl-D-alanine ligase
MKKIAKSLVVSILSWQVKRLRKSNEFKVVGVVGSIGKTSTKFAIAQVLSQSLRVRYQEGNYNDIVTVPLIFFGLDEPSLMNPLAWLATFIRIEKQLRKDYPYDVVVAEIGTDGPNQISQFGRYLRCDISVVTALSLEHMEFFEDIEQVAAEELSVAQLSDLLVINADLCSDKYYSNADFNYYSYGTREGLDYTISDLKLSDKSASFSLNNKSAKWLEVKMKAISKGQVYSATAAAIVADIMAIDLKSIQEGVKKLKPVSGRMQQLKGYNGSLIIDESYNSSPEAVKEALDTLYRMSSPQKIAVLGNMNELGKFSKQSHQDVGKYCDPKQLDLVLTIGKDANEYTAEAATHNGCKVLSFDSPYSLGKKVKDIIKPDGIVLFKGSQNGVFLEEAIKLVLEDKSDSSLLVRQSPYWLKQKSKFAN